MGTGQQSDIGGPLAEGIDLVCRYSPFEQKTLELVWAHAFLIGNAQHFLHMPVNPHLLYHPLNQPVQIQWQGSLKRMSHKTAVVGSENTQNHRLKNTLVKKASGVYRLTGMIVSAKLPVVVAEIAAANQKQTQQVVAKETIVETIGTGYGIKVLKITQPRRTEIGVAARVQPTVQAPRRGTIHTSLGRDADPAAHDCEKGVS